MKDSTAWKISAVLHPLLVVPVSALIYLKLKGLGLVESLQWVSIWITISILPVVTYTYFKGEKGLNIKDKELRRPVYLLGLLSLLAYYLVVSVLNGPDIVLKGLVIGGLSVVVFGFLNNYSKVSVHTGALTATGTAFLTVRPFIGIVILSAGLLTGKSRIQLEKHSIKEVVYGALTGILCGLFFLI